MAPIKKKPFRFRGSGKAYHSGNATSSSRYEFYLYHTKLDPLSSADASSTTTTCVVCEDALRSCSSISCSRTPLCWPWHQDNSVV